MLKHYLGDLFWMVVVFLAVTGVGYWLRGQGVAIPPLPDWLIGL